MPSLMFAVPLLVVSTPVWAQPATPRLSFEVATIKPSVSTRIGSSSSATKAQIAITNMSIKRLIERAFNVREFQVVGPDWIEKIKFDITAKLPDGAKPAETGSMIRSLLEDRFKLVVHEDFREVSGYALGLAKGPLKAKSTEESASAVVDRPGRISTITAKASTMEEFAAALTRNLVLPVVDKTGLQGHYNFELKFASDDHASDRPSSDLTDAPSLFAAMQEQLGLKLQAQKVKVKAIVVDSVDRTPTEN